MEQLCSPPDTSTTVTKIIHVILCLKRGSYYSLQRQISRENATLYFSIQVDLKHFHPAPGWFVEMCAAINVIHVTLKSFGHRTEKQTHWWMFRLWKTICFWQLDKLSCISHTYCERSVKTYVGLKDFGCFSVLLFLNQSYFWQSVLNCELRGIWVVHPSMSVSAAGMY